MERENRFDVENCVRLLDIQPDDHVLEVGFGPGLGLQLAYNYIRGTVNEGGGNSGLVQSVSAGRDDLMKSCTELFFMVLYKLG